jgi:hypothetical protein
MSCITLSIRLRGELPSIFEVDQFIGISPTFSRKKGDLLSEKTKRRQPIDVWVLDLTPKINFDSTDDEIKEQFSFAEDLLRQIAPNIAMFDRDKVLADLFISCTVDKCQEGFILSQQLIEAAAIAKLEINVSILTILI